jgi:hypothetical protein
MNFCIHCPSIYMNICIDYPNIHKNICKKNVISRFCGNLSGFVKLRKGFFSFQTPTLGAKKTLPLILIPFHFFC